MRVALLSVIGVLASSLGASTSLYSSEPEAARFVKQVQPLLAAKCISCHGAEKQEGGLRLDSLAAALQGGDRGAAIVPGKIAESLLVEAVKFTNPDLQMPPKLPLNAAEVALLSDWVAKGAAWVEPVRVLFEDDPAFLKSLGSGNGRARLVADEPFAGKFALGITPLQRDGVRIPGWEFRIRENPQSGEYRYLRMAWRKSGPGGIMLELALNGSWPAASSAAGRYAAGPNQTGWAAISLSDTAPRDWTVVTVDLWKDLGDVTLTGCAPTCDQGEEAFFDSLLLASSVASLDAYVPGSPLTDGSKPGSTSAPIGNAFTDARNPIRRLFGEERLDLWSLRLPTATELPDPSKPSIDSLVQQKLAAHQIQPSPRADRRTLIRRLTFALTGLPPTPQEVEQFLVDPAADAYERLVERLLASPRYGERQAQWWLDVVRYADTNGYERDEFRPLAWQYRDYVVRSFNQDKPYDQFVREQLAGDELLSGPPQNQAEADRLVATGYLRLGQWDSTASIFQEEKRLQAEVMADLTNTTASAFLGLTYSCCQCHDHKYDPLTQADHFRLRAFFAAVKPSNEIVIELPDEQQQRAAWNAKLDEQIEAAQAEQGKLDAKAEPGKARHAELEQQIKEWTAQKRQPRMAMGVTDEGPAAPATHLFYQGDFLSPREEVAPGFPSVLDPQDARIEPPRSDTTGRRLALANWIVSPENPWTARVLVNRIWQLHFGKGLVATPNDFGYSGSQPTHPELLDWLSLEFIRGGWSIKNLHRWIVLSETYQQASRPTASSTTPDSEVAVAQLARQHVRRLDAESLRDALLSVSGLLQNYDSGKPLWPAVPDELLKAQPAILEAEKGGDGGRMQGWYTDPVEQTDVRTLFLVRKRALAIPFLQSFDLPDNTVSCARRDSTVVAPQALTLLNSPESLRFAKATAERVRTAVGNDPRKQVDYLFQMALARSPHDEESDLALDLLQRHAEQHGMGKQPEEARLLALVDLARAILNSNEFLYID